MRLVSIRPQGLLSPRAGQLIISWLANRSAVAHWDGREGPS